MSSIRQHVPSFRQNTSVETSCVIWEAFARTKERFHIECGNLKKEHILFFKIANAL